ncbi:hypothetical protein HK102_012925, partial [Quaeritorhiza haematococci]
VFGFSITIPPTQQLMIQLVCDRLIGSEGVQLGQNYNHTTFVSADFGGEDLLTPLKPDVLASLPDYLKCAADTNVQANTSWWTMILSLAANIPGLISAPVVGAISDNVGRKHAILFPILGGILRILALVVVTHFRLSLWVLFVSYIFEGLLGSFMVLEAAAFAYIADTSDGKGRTSLFGRIEAAVFTAFMVAPYFGGFATRQ